MHKEGEQTPLLLGPGAVRPGSWLGLCSAAKSAGAQNGQDHPANPRIWRSSPGHGALRPPLVHWDLSAVLVWTGHRPEGSWVEGTWKGCPLLPKEHS